MQPTPCGGPTPMAAPVRNNVAAAATGGAPVLQSGILRSGILASKIIQPAGGKK